MKKYNNIFKLYERMINTIGLVSIRINPKGREVAMNLSLLMLSFIGIAKYLNDRAKHLLHYHKNIAILFGCIFLLLLLVASIDRRVDYKRFKCRHGFVTGWLICFGMAFVLTFIHPVTKGYFLWTAMSLLFAIPFAMIWSERDDFDHLCDILAKNVLIAVAVFILMNFTLTPFVTYTGAGDYLGIVANANNNGFMCTAGYAAALYKLLRDRRYHVLYAIIMGLCISITIVSICRTGELAIMAETMVGLAYYLRIVKKTEEDTQFSKLIVSAAIVLVVAYVARYALIRLDQMDLNSYAFEGEEVATEVVQEEGLDTQGKIDSMSSGRISIWKAYINNSTFWGNGNKNKGPQLEGNADSRYAHNNAIEVLFVSGYIAFAGYVIWIIAGLVFVIKCLMGKYGWKKSYIMVVMVFTGYFVQAMLEILIYPMNNIPAMMMYVCLMPIILDMREEDQSVE